MNQSIEMWLENIPPVSALTDLEYFQAKIMRSCGIPASYFREQLELPPLPDFELKLIPVNSKPRKLNIRWGENDDIKNFDRAMRIVHAY